MTPLSKSPPPVLHLQFPQSPLLDDTLSQDILSRLAAQGISTSLPPLSFASSKSTVSPRLRPAAPPQDLPRTRAFSGNKPLPAIPTYHSPIPPKQIIRFLQLLEDMDNNVMKEVQRTKESIKEARALICETRQEGDIRLARLKKRKDREKRETKGPDDEFWLNA